MKMNLVLPLAGGPVELALRRRNTASVLDTIAVTEQADVDIAAVDFRQIDLIGPPVARRQVLEQEHREEATQERVSLDERLHRAALLGELLLDAADENQSRAHTVVALPAVHIPR